MKKWLAVVVVIITIWIVGGYFYSRSLTAPLHEKYADITLIDSFPVKNVSLLTSDKLHLQGWYADAGNKKAVILLAGIRSNCTEMIDRAKIYLENGFSVMLVDLRGTGRSDGDFVGFGWDERLDLLACVRWLRAHGNEKIGVHGCSLGAATIAYSFDSVSNYSFIVMESSYYNIDHAFRNRTNAFIANHFVSWPVYFFTDSRIGVNSDSLSPVNCVRRYHGPVLYFAGDAEKNIPIGETNEIFSSFGSNQKAIHIFHGADHVDFLKFDPADFNKWVIDFFHSNAMQL